MDEDRRQHRRLAIRLPLECCASHESRDRALRTVTTNISTGGLYFELDLIDGVSLPEPRELLNIELTVPPGDGHFPYAGRVSSMAQVVRCEPLPLPPSEAAASVPRYGVAAQFRDAIKLAF